MIKAYKKQNKLIHFASVFAKTKKNTVDELKNLLYSQQVPSIQEIQKLHQNYQENFSEFKSFLYKKLQNFSNSMQEQICSISRLKFDFVELIQEYPKSDQCYIPAMQSNLKFQENCQQMTFNLDDTILAAGCDEKIVFFQFLDKNLIYNSEVKIEGMVIYLKFISQKSNQLLSIIQYDQKVAMFPEPSCVDFSQGWLACGCFEGNLHLWKQYGNEFQIEQKIADLGEMQSVSFNNQCDKLISGGKRQKISIFQRNSTTDKWIIFQLICYKSEILSIQFFNNHRFVIYEPKIQQLSTYTLKGVMFERENNKKLQGSVNDVLINPLLRSKWFFYFSFNYLSFFNYSPINNFCELKSQMYFEGEFQGCLSNNEEYLIIWDGVTKEYQVRQQMNLID